MKPIKMKKIVILVTVFSLIIISCDKSNETNLTNNTSIEGEYIGTFERSGSISNVELNLNDNEFNGNSDIDKFPAICNGEFTISDDTLIFENKCGWYANFDWTLILNENWNYTYENSTLTMVKSNGDKYILIRQ